MNSGTEQIHTLSLISIKNSSLRRTWYRTSILSKIDGFREGFEGSQDYDMTLRFLDAGGRNFAHIPRVFYHWRAIEGSTAFLPSEKSYTDSASVRALRDHVARNGWEADVTVSPELSYFSGYGFTLLPPPWSA